MEALFLARNTDKAGVTNITVDGTAYPIRIVRSILPECYIKMRQAI